MILNYFYQRYINTARFTKLHIFVYCLTILYFKYFTSSTFIGVVVFTLTVYLVFSDIKKARSELEELWADAKIDLGRLFVDPLTVKLLGSAVIKSAKVGYAAAKPSVIACVGCIIAGGAVSEVIANNTYQQIRPLADTLDILRGAEQPSTVWVRYSNYLDGTYIRPVGIIDKTK